MYLKILSALALAGACALEGAAGAQDAVPLVQPSASAQPTPLAATPAAGQQTVAADQPAAVPAPCCKLAALTPVELEILTPASSKTSYQGQPIHIRVVDAISADGKVLIPAGTEGSAEVVQVSRGAFGGKAGELVIGAPYLMLAGQRIGLKRLLYGSVSGKDRFGQAVVATAVIGIAGMLFSGGNIDIASGTRANAVVTTDTLISVQP